VRLQSIPRFARWTLRCLSYPIGIVWIVLITIQWLNHSQSILAWYTGIVDKTSQRLVANTMNGTHQDNNAFDATNKFSLRQDDDVSLVDMKGTLQNGTSFVSNRSFHSYHHHHHQSPVSSLETKLTNQSPPAFDVNEKHFLMKPVETRAKRVWRLYMLQHSQSVLEKEYRSQQDNQQRDTTQHGSSTLLNATGEIDNGMLQHLPIILPDRLYTVAYYWCPHRMGNVLHNFFNVITWGIIHNRTILWQYDANSTPSPQHNSFASCQAILPLNTQRLPSWQEWSIKLKLPSPVPISFLTLEQQKQNNQLEQSKKGLAALTRTNNTTINTMNNGNHSHRSSTTLTKRILPYLDFSSLSTPLVVLFPQIPDVLFHARQNIERNSWRDHPLQTSNYREYIRKTFFENAANTSSFSSISNWQQQKLLQQRNVIRDVYSHGIYYWFGLLFRSIFTIPPPLPPPPPLSSPSSVLFNKHSDDRVTTISRTVFSVVLHSRHTVEDDDGSFVQDEIKCLETVLSNGLDIERFDQNITLDYNNPTKDTMNKDTVTTISSNTPYCYIYLLSDRINTVQLLSQWIRRQFRHNECIPVSTLPSLSFDTPPPPIILSQNETTESFASSIVALTSTSLSKEHGPRPGIGFLMDLSLGAQARNGMIGDPTRSSYALVRSLATYDTIEEEMHHLSMEESYDNDETLHNNVGNKSDDQSSSSNNNNNKRSRTRKLNHVECTLPSRPISGYNYGPGTPTFRHHSRGK
jgi:hypothetical protein